MQWLYGIHPSLGTMSIGDVHVMTVREMMDTFLSSTLCGRPFIWDGDFRGKNYFRKMESK
jgi:hypothetical protein